MALAFITELSGNILAAIAIVAAGWFFGRWRAMVSWQRKEFKDRVVLALNTITNEGSAQKLSLRTLFEKDLKDVLQNDSMVRIIHNTIANTSVENPILPITREDSWYILNAVLNKIAEEFASGILRRDMGIPVTTKRYTFCITFEKEGGIRMQKIRIMLIQKEVLQNFPEVGELLLESEKHSTRVQTLRMMKKEMTLSPHLFMDIDLYQ